MATFRYSDITYIIIIHYYQSCILHVVIYVLDPERLSEGKASKDVVSTGSNEDPDSLDLTDTKEDPVTSSIYYRYCDIMGKRFELYKRDLDSLYPGEHLSD